MVMYWRNLPTPFRVKPPRCGGPRPLQSAGRHPVVSMECIQSEAGIIVCQCRVCGRFLLIFREEVAECSKD